MLLKDQNVHNVTTATATPGIFHPPTLLGLSMCLQLSLPLLQP